MQTNRNVHKCIRMQLHTHKQSIIHTDKQMDKQTHTVIQTYKYVQQYIYIYTQLDAHKQSVKHTDKQMDKQAHTYN